MTLTQSAHSEAELVPITAAILSDLQLAGKKTPEQYSVTTCHEHDFSCRSQRRFRDASVAAFTNAAAQAVPAAGDAQDDVAGNAVAPGRYGPTAGAAGGVQQRPSLPRRRAVACDRRDLDGTDPRTRRPQHRTGG